MHPKSTSEHVFPLSQGSPERPLLRAPRLPFSPKPSVGPVMGHAAFVRAWSGRRAGRALPASANST